MLTLLIIIQLATIIKSSATIQSPEDVLDGRLGVTDRRYLTMKVAMDIMRNRGHKILVETGTARRGDRGCQSDGCSTVIFSRWAMQNPGMKLVSVDNNEQAIADATDAVGYYNQTSLVLADSVTFLKEYTGLIDFLYLDTMDFDSNNPRPSQELPLREIIAAYPKLHEDSMVMVDDCGLSFGGKCTLVELFLKELGWRTLMKGYQLIMVTGKRVIL